jgi:hypothetical protein
VTVTAASDCSAATAAAVGGGAPFAHTTKAMAAIARIPNRINNAMRNPDRLRRCVGGVFVTVFDMVAPVGDG